MGKLGWYFETFEGWTTLLKDKEPYCDWDSRGSDDPPSNDQRAELLRILNAHEPMLAALKKYGRHDYLCTYRRAEKCNCGYSAALAEAEVGEG